MELRHRWNARWPLPSTWQEPDPCCAQPGCRGLRKLRRKWIWFRSLHQKWFPIQRLRGEALQFRREMDTLEQTTSGSQRFSVRMTENCFPSALMTDQKVRSLVVWGNSIQALIVGHLKTSGSFLYWGNACILRTWPDNGRKEENYFIPSLVYRQSRKWSMGSYY